MTESHGFIRTTTEIKILILYVLRVVGAPIDSERLAELCLVDGGFNYFDFKLCLSNLIEHANIEENGGKLTLTAKGSRACESLEEDIPYSVKNRAKKLADPVGKELRRASLIKANHEKTDDGIIVYLALNDGMGLIFDLKILVADEAQAKAVEKNFFASPELFYSRFVTMLSEDTK